MMTDRFGVHFCPLDADCRKYGAPKRLHVFTPWGTLIAGERTQAWLPGIGYAPLRWGGWGWWPVVFHPRDRRDDE